MVKLVIVDDHQILVEGLSALIKTMDGVTLIGSERSGEALLDRDDLSQIDIIIMDIKMEGMDGIDTLTKLRKNGVQAKCIFLSSYGDLKLVNEAVKQGASAYLTKSSASIHLAEAISAVRASQVYYSPDVKERILNAFTKIDSRAASEYTEQSLLRQLTERERDVLRLIALQYTSEEISKELYIAKSTVDTHRKNLIAKLKVKNAVGLGLFAERNNLI